jgi:hypothetical protein
MMQDVHTAHVVMEAKLMKFPKTLPDYGRGVSFFSGFKPAKDCLASKRGRDKYKYYRRNVFSQKVSELVMGEVLLRELVIGFMLFEVLLQLFLIL